MRFRQDAGLDTSQIEDARGSGGGLGGIPIPVAGGLGVVVLVAYLLISALGGDGGLSGPLSNLDNRTAGSQPPSQVLGSECRTGADANRREDCRIVADVNSVQSYWAGRFRQIGRTYVPAKTVFFTSSIGTGCGTATSDVGPFCPVDKLVYIDLGFSAT